MSAMQSLFWNYQSPEPQTRIFYYRLLEKPHPQLIAKTKDQDAILSARPSNLVWIQGFFEKKLRGVQYVYWSYLDQNEKKRPILIERNLRLSRLFRASLVHIMRIWCWLCPRKSSTRPQLLWWLQALDKIIDWQKKLTADILVQPS